MPKPPDFHELKWSKSQPLDIEIGCGVGFHPIRYCLANPDRQLIAFEKTQEKMERFQSRLKNHPSLKNLTAIHGDAIAWITYGISSSQVDRYFTLYPNPYPKPAQRNKRFHAMPFNAHLLDSLKKNGQLILASNESFYCEEAIDFYTGHWGLKLVQEETLGAFHIPRTHFEKKYLSRGEVCRNLVFEKTN